MTLAMGAVGVRGSWGAYEINGSLNTYKTAKALYAVWAGVKTVAVADSKGAYSTFSFKIAKNGSVSVKGNLANGTTMSVTTRLMITDDGSEACVAVKGTAKVPVGFTLWLAQDDADKVVAEGIESETGDELAGDAVAGDAAVTASSFVLNVGDVAVEVAYDGKSFKAPKGSGVSLRYTKTTGAFSGSFKIDVVNAKGSTSRKTVSFKGVFIDGVGYGVTTTKGSAGVAVKVVANGGK
jgi:hypothetical protein